MSSLDDLKYYLASRGATPEQIEQSEHDVLNMIIATGRSVESIAYTILITLRAFNQFADSMREIENIVGEATQDLQQISAGILALAEETPPQPTKKAERTPYYQKDKAQWWK